MQITELSAILEIATHPNGKDYPRYAKAIACLKASVIGNYPVLAVYGGDIDPCHVPGFDHNFMCENGKHICQIQPYGVQRYFNITVWIEGEPTIADLQTYRLTEYARLIVCGMGQPYEPGKSPLSLIREV